jgi:1,5-anhydro-D-fructose reductase (1,5-anhydro-D-mannitol-forming)
MIRLAVLSFWHVHAKDYSKQAAERSDTEIVAVWDDLPERGRAAVQQWGGQFEERLPTLLACDDIDAVVVVTPTNQHRSLSKGRRKAECQKSTPKQRHKHRIISNQAGEKTP